MKELSIEEKAKAYVNIIEKANKIHHENCEACQICIEELIPELKESEDERIRNEIIAFVEQAIHRGGGTLIPQEQEDRWIAWFEKQSTPQVRTGLEWVNTIDDACDKRYSEEYAHGEYCHEQSFKWGFQEGVDWLEKQGEQNHAWSEEDKNAIQVLKDIVKHSNEINENIYTIPLKEKLYDWLKSLRPKSQWKPTEEQITWLYRATDDASKGSRMKQVLENLLSDLKKLREE